MDYVEETIEKYEKYINPAQAKLFRFMGLASIEGHAEGWTITDSEGQEFIDCLGGYGMFALGHRHPKVVEAVEKELHAMPMCGKVLFNRPMADLAEALADKNGSVIAICHARPNTAKCWAKYAGEFKKTGVTFVPLTELLY